MKKPTLFLFAFSLLASVVTAGVKTGASAPDFTLKDTQGVAHKLTDFKGKFVVLEWTNHQCPFVKKFYSQGDMQALQKKMTDDGVIWLQVVSSAEGKQGYVDAAAGEALRKSKGMASTAMLLDADGTVGKLYDARTTPHVYLINPEGKLVYQGAIDSIRSTKASDVAKAENYLKSAYESAVAGQPIAKDTTTAYGCSVKY